MAKTAATRRRQMMLFARNFFKHPRMLGSIIPSSRFLVRDLMRQVDWRRARVIVEYGPGVGNITAEVLKRMHRDARLVVFETNDDFVEFLRRSIPDPRLTVVHGSAADVARVLEEHGLGQADCVISGIPFSTMPEQVGTAIVRATRRSLRPGGRFLVYQFSREVSRFLKPEFRDIREAFEPLNILPARLYFCSV
ncbi:class I SAM-dependent methyltransferase [Longimicrobium sp.]|uniref:class I SAM-dependent methyltransferase n=1 Tax=Longimicrobium sp. TaxID=2029185 RepID=UPI002BACF8D8|nr:rRNA adenine N-6-methyltransferase family protein [Longimicrobium sp.]HSU12965.1 rRNA adenine N-6-methyltransferase family protein [Longimicrobium sp.]